ncbi:MAG: 3-deoxy-7-phosphoheptulonate synthase [Planctomycetes bacterium]|nr:3-deoxy-7-phosphoheptulonate synthase [Planctomycetota bacterium]
MSWSRGSWRSSKGSHQIPAYPDSAALRDAEDRLKTYPPLVFAGEIRQLKVELARVAEGKAFLLQGGDCVETFADFNTFNIRDTFRVLLQMALILTFVGEKPVVRVGRVAGQFAKPRSVPVEKTADGAEIMTYRGDMINAVEETVGARTPDPERMLRAYFQSAATLNLLRAFAGGGYADLHRAGKWLLDFVGKSQVRDKYENLAKSINKTLGVMRAYEEREERTGGRDQRVDFYSSHEALFLPYEEALCRNDSLTGDPVAVSAHCLWLGERTRDPEGPQVEFLRGVINPLGIKCGPKAEPQAVERLLEKLNPVNEKGRIILILRAGVNKAEWAYSRFVREMASAGREVVWCIDPMHGNSRLNESGVKTRLFSDILHECKIFIDVCRAEKVHPGGLHLEMTGKNVTECLGGADDVCDLSSHYETSCDPRLNASQALELAFAVAEHLTRG